MRPTRVTHSDLSRALRELSDALDLPPEASLVLNVPPRILSMRHRDRSTLLLDSGTVRDLYLDLVAMRRGVDLAHAVCRCKEIDALNL